MDNGRSDPDMCYDSSFGVEDVGFLPQSSVAMTSEHVQELSSMCQLSRTKEKAQQSKLPGKFS
jgi:hypothetical protein